MAGWNGLSLSIASRLLATVNIEVAKNEEEGCIIATHPQTKAVIRRPSVTGCVEAVLREWMVLK